MGTDTPAPVIRLTTYGKFLAISATDARFRFGVIGATEDEARRLYATSYARWAELGDQDEPSFS